MSLHTAPRCNRLEAMIFLAHTLLILLVGHCLGYDLDDDKRQDLVPFPRVGRGGYWTWMEDKRQGLVPFPRVGRAVYGVKRQGLIPFPRIGRSYPKPDIDFDDWDDWDDGYSFATFKRGPLAFTPRIGRKKRSTNQDDSIPSDSNKATTGAAGEMAKTLRQTPWEYLNWDDTDGVDMDPSYDRQSRQMIPTLRVGRGSLIPRLGRKRSDSDGESAGSKRAAFTPRIGRAPLIPRIGRADPDISVRSRAAFIPRLGRAAFVPRIGRSEQTQEDQSTSNK